MILPSCRAQFGLRRRLPWCVEVFFSDGAAGLENRIWADNGLLAADRKMLLTKFLLLRGGKTGALVFPFKT